MKKTRYKFLRTGYRSERGNHKWKFGKWHRFNGKLDMCRAGFHCSKGIYQAFYHVQGEILAKVEVGGKHLLDKDKEVWEEMRIVKSWEWNKRDSVLFSIYAARLVLKNFEDKYPDDNRPRRAIEVAEAWVKSPTVKNRSAARLAAWFAEYAGWVLEVSAEYAARSAEYAARSVGSAEYAARSVVSAESAARSVGFAEYAAESVCRKLDEWMESHLKELRVLRELKVLVKKIDKLKENDRPRT